MTQGDPPNSTAFGAVQLCTKTILKYYPPPLPLPFKTLHHSSPSAKIPNKSPFFSSKILENNKGKTKKSFRLCLHVKSFILSSSSSSATNCFNSIPHFPTRHLRPQILQIIHQAQFNPAVVMPRLLGLLRRSVRRPTAYPLHLRHHLLS